MTTTTRAPALASHGAPSPKSAQQRFNRATRFSCAEAYDWGWFNNHIYVYTPADPGVFYAGMKVSQRQFAIGMPNNDPKEHVVIDGFDLLYTQSKGFYGGYPARAAHHLTIRDCHVASVGIKGAASAYGLAVWHSDLLIQDNEIHDCGRRSVSYNVYATRGVTFENVVIERNHFHHGFHTTGVDIANSGTDTFQSFTIRGNLFEGDPTDRNFLLDITRPTLLQ